MEFVDKDIFFSGGGVDSKIQTKVNVFNHIGALSLVILTHFVLSRQIKKGSLKRPRASLYLFFALLV